MKKRKVVKYIAIISIALIILMISFMFRDVTSEKIAEGRYKIENFGLYPDAYITVKEDKIQFHNIDLNAIYQEQQLQDYSRVVEINSQNKLENDKLEEFSNLNKAMVENEYTMPYGEGDKTGTFSYLYFAYPGRNVFGLVIEYDALHKTIKINNEIQVLMFRR